MEISKVQNNQTFGAWHKYAQDRMILYLSNRSLTRPLGMDSLIAKIDLASTNHIVEFEGHYGFPVLIAKPLLSLQGKAKTITISNRNLKTCLKQMKKSIEKENERLLSGSDVEPSIPQETISIAKKITTVAKEKYKQLSDYAKKHLSEATEEIKNPDISDTPIAGKIPPLKPIKFPSTTSNKSTTNINPGKLMPGEPPITIFDKFPVSQS